MNLKSINIYSLIITISPKKGIDASVNIPFKGGEVHGGNYSPNGDILL